MGASSEACCPSRQRAQAAVPLAMEAGDRTGVPSRPADSPSAGPEAVEGDLLEEVRTATRPSVSGRAGRSWLRRFNLISTGGAGHRCEEPADSSEPLDGTNPPGSAPIWTWRAK